MILNRSPISKYLYNKNNDYKVLLTHESQVKFMKVLCRNTQIENKLLKKSVSLCAIT